jgi:hypothetical protein
MLERGCRYMYTWVCLFVCVCVRTYNVDMCMSVCMYAKVSLFICVYMRTYVRTHTHTHTHTRTYKHMHLHTHKHINNIYTPTCIQHTINTHSNTSSTHAYTCVHITQMHYHTNINIPETQSHQQTHSVPCPLRTPVSTRAVHPKHNSSRHPGTPGQLPGCSVSMNV